MKTSSAEKYGYRCPKCGDETTQDPSGKGFVRHKTNRKCQFEAGLRDPDGHAPATPQVYSEADAPRDLPSDLTVRGFSERGIFNALLYEISYAQNSLWLLERLLNLVVVPNGGVNLHGLTGAEILIEQSLSDFGDADAVLLVHGDDWRCAVFMEGKVKPYQQKSWSVRNAWVKFTSGIAGKLNSSNLFTQLYHKVRFVAALRSGKITALKHGVDFPKCSKKPVRRIGDNHVILRATNLIAPYVHQSLFVAVVPDEPQYVAEFFEHELAAFTPDDLPEWETRDWGYLCWKAVESFCLEHELVNTLRVFEFNRGQIY